MPTTHALTPDDETLAAALADAVVAGAAHDPALRRLALRAAGLAKEPADMTQDELAESYGCDQATICRMALRALKKLQLSPEFRGFNLDR